MFQIKALEQQQSRLLVVREIPDKPPPPYTPPAETKPKPPRMFILDEPTEIKIRKSLSDSVIITKPDEENSAFDLFLEDFCHESLERHKQEQSDKPWDACNLLPQKPPVDTDKLVHNTIVEIKEVLTSVGPTVVSGKCFMLCCCFFFNSHISELLRLLQSKFNSIEKQIIARIVHK